MKKLFSILLSLHLIMAPVVASAQEDAYLTKGTGSQGGYDFYAKQLLIIGTSTVGANIVTQCLKGVAIPSIALFMTGSITHIGSEIAGAEAKNARHKEKLANLKILEEKLKKTGDASQKEIMEQQLVEEKETLKFLENRRMWMMAVAAIYGTAAGFAIGEGIAANAAGISAGTAACTVDANKSCGLKCVGVPGCLLPCVTASIIACKAASTPALAMVKSPVVGPETDKLANAACTGSALFAAPCKAQLKSYMLIAYGACGKERDGGLANKALAMLLSYGYGFVGKDGGAISQYGTMMTGLMNTFVPSISKKVPYLYNYPQQRRVTFLAAAAGATLVWKGLDTRVGIAKENITKLTKALAQFKDESEGEKAGLGLDDPATTGGSAGGANATPVYDLNKLADENGVKQCFASPAGAWDYSASACKNSIQIPKANVGSFKLPTMSKVANLSSQLGQAIVDGDTAKAAALAGEIGTYATRVDEENDKLIAEENKNADDLKKSKDLLNESVQSQTASLQSSLNDAAASNKVDLAALGKDKSSLDQDKKSAPVMEATVAVPSVTIPDSDLAGITTDDVALDPASQLSSSKADQSLDEFESTTQDISKESDTSIFKQLSNRYILNYSKMFERKKAPDAN